MYSCHRAGAVPAADCLHIWVMHGSEAFAGQKELGPSQPKIYLTQLLLRAGRVPDSVRVGWRNEIWEVDACGFFVGSSGDSLHSQRLFR